MFNELLVLGQIPGTDIQITFNEFILLLPLAAALIFAIKHRLPRERLAYFWLYARLYITVRRGVQLKLPV